MARGKGSGSDAQNVADVENRETGGVLAALELKVGLEAARLAGRQVVAVCHQREAFRSVRAAQIGGK
jgi:hypothetical protein